MTRRHLRFNAVRIHQKIEARRAQALAKADGLILAATRGAPSRLLQKMPLCRRAPTSEVRIDRASRTEVRFDVQPTPSNVGRRLLPARAYEQFDTRSGPGPTSWY